MKKRMTYVARIALAGTAGLCAGWLLLPDNNGHVPPQAAATEAVTEEAVTEEAGTEEAGTEDAVVVAAAEAPPAPPAAAPGAPGAPAASHVATPPAEAPAAPLEEVEVKRAPEVQAQSLPPQTKAAAVEDVKAKDPKPAPQKAAPRWSEDEAVAAVEKYFRSSETLRATFTQYAPDGTRSTGVLSLKRPGRVRFEYDAPSPLLIIADGVWITLADKEMDTVDRYPVSATPLGVILQDDKNLRKEAIVTGFYQDIDRFELIVRARENPGLGRLSLKLTKNPVTLDGWAVEDAQGLVTEIRLADMKTGMDLNPALFHISDIKKTRDR